MPSLDHSHHNKDVVSLWQGPPSVENGTAMGPLQVGCGEMFRERRCEGSLRLSPNMAWLCYAAGMKTLTKELWMNVPQRRAIVSLHKEVERLAAESGVRDGLVLINAMHITASVFINDNESGLHHDYEVWLEQLAPFDASSQRYDHNRTGEDNADAHLKRQVMGREVVVAITDGKLHLGPWEHIFYYEFDGRRRKRVLVKIIGE